MAKVHVLKDESLGGVKREYVEVDMEAKFGDYVIVFEHSHKDCNGIRRVLSVSDSGYIYFHVDYLGECGAPPENYRVLEPTDIVIIGGKRYRIEERLAEPGELILIKKNGLTYEVFEQKGDFIVVSGESQRYKLEEDYVVLKRIDAPQSQDDIIANLVGRVAELERRDEKHREVIEELSLEISNIDRLYDGVFGEVTGVKRDIETWAQEVETVKYTNEEIYSRLGHLEKDVDEREDKPQTITIDVDTLAKLIGGVRG